MSHASFGINLYYKIIHCYLKSQLNWASCVLSRSCTQKAAGGSEDLLLKALRSCRGWGGGPAPLTRGSPRAHGALLDSSAPCHSLSLCFSKDSSWMEAVSSAPVQFPQSQCRIGTWLSPWLRDVGGRAPQPSHSSGAMCSRGSPGGSQQCPGTVIHTGGPFLNVPLLFIWLSCLACPNSLG